MGQKSYFERLLNYDRWANAEVLAGLGKMQPCPARPVELMAHIISAERLWLDRILGRTQTFPVWPAFTLDECNLQAVEAAKLWAGYLEDLPESAFDQPIEYHNTVGESWSSRVEDIFTHVMMHSTYHRGQIATNLREAGLVPAYTDYIHSIRQKLVE